MTDVSNPFSILFRYKYYFFDYYPYPFSLGFDFHPSYFGNELNKSVDQTPSDPDGNG